MGRGDGDGIGGGTHEREGEREGGTHSMEGTAWKPIQMSQRKP